MAAFNLSNNSEQQVIDRSTLVTFPEYTISSDEMDRLHRIVRNSALVFFVCCALLASLAMVGWLIDITGFYSVLPDFATTKFNTALCFLLLSVSAGVQLHNTNHRVQFVGMALCIGALSIAVLTLIEYLLGVGLGIDQLFWSDQFTPPDEYPGRMSVATALGIFGSAIASLSLDRRWIFLSRFSAFVVLTLGLVGLLSHLFDPASFYSVVPFSSMALLTSICFLSLGAGYLLADHERPYLQFLFLNSMSAHIARRFALYFLALPPVLVAIAFLGEELFGFGPRFSLLFLVAIFMVVSLAGIRRIAYLMHNAEMTNNRQNLRNQLNQERLYQVKKVESMALVAGGVAHDFRNLLMPIIWSAEIGGSSAVGNESDRKRYRTILEAAQKASALAERMLDLGRQKPVSFSDIKLDDFLRDFHGILEGIGKGRVQIQIETNAFTPRVYADKTQIEQVLVNLVTNACQAIEGQGVVTIGVSRCCLLPSAMGSLASSQIVSGEYICLYVSDTGPGMSEEERASALKPFYSNKKNAEGIGLGLSTVSNIVDQHLGAIDIASAPGKGATVFVYLPVRVHAKPFFVASGEESSPEIAAQQQPSNNSSS